MLLTMLMSADIYIAYRIPPKNHPSGSQKSNVILMEESFTIYMISQNIISWYLY